MRSPLSALRGAGREVHGTVSSSGAILSGTGYTVVRSAAGHYSVTFIPSFDSPPDVIASSSTPGPGFSTAPVVAPDTVVNGSFDLTTFATDTRLVTDQGFAFVAKERTR